MQGCETRRLDRRRLLKYGLVSAAAIAGGWFWVATFGPRSTTSPGPDPAIRDLGTLYLLRYPEERDRARLLQLLELRDDPWPLLQNLRSGPLARLIRADAEKDRFVELDGWLLTQSEARLLALAVVD